MRDALIHVGWHSTVLAMICFTTLLGLATMAQSLFALLAGAWSNSATLLLVALVAAGCVKWLCDHRDELIEA